MPRSIHPSSTSSTSTSCKSALFYQTHVVSYFQEILTFNSHFVNAAPLYLFINSQSWIPVETKVRLLEWKIRLDILLYAVIGVPDLSLEDIKAYQPKNLVTASVTGK